MANGLPVRSLRFLAGLAAALAVPLSAALADPLAVKVGVIRMQHSRETISILEIPAADDFVAGAKLAMADNNTTGKFLDQSFSLEDVKLEPDDDAVAAAKTPHRFGRPLPHRGPSGRKACQGRRRCA